MNNIKKITSFEVDHRTLNPGMYVSRRDGDITTYDLRTRRPNADNYMDNETMHTVEHMFATYIRNSDIANNVIYFGPMGCQTGFYLLTRDINDNKVYETVKTVLLQIIGHNGEVFGASEKECGNYQTLVLEKAQAECENYLRVLNNIKNLNYAED